MSSECTAIQYISYADIPINVWELFGVVPKNQNLPAPGTRYDMYRSQKLWGAGVCIRKKIVWGKTPTNRKKIICFSREALPWTRNLLTAKPFKSAYNLPLVLWIATSPWAHAIPQRHRKIFREEGTQNASFVREILTCVRQGAWGRNMR